MFFEILLFALLGILLGILFGLVPGIHPNLIVLSLPFLLVLNIEPLLLLSFIVAMGVTNSIVDFIPSVLLGAPDAGNELAILPGHRMLMQGNGYQAVKLTVIGGVGSVVVCSLLLPVLIFLVPFLFATFGNYIYILLIAIVLVMVLTERVNEKRIWALLCFFLAGIIGLLAGRLPIDNNLVLFPILSGMFGMSLLVLQIRNKTKIPEQKKKEELVSHNLINRSVLSGSLGGIGSGLLPGVGSSEIASLASVDKNDKSFLITIGALTTANIIISLLAMWLIGKTRSGIAVVVNQLMEIGFNEFLLIVFVSLIACGVGAVATLLLTRKILSVLGRINYSQVSLAVIFMLIILVFVFTSYYGLLLAITCCALGIFANLVKIKRGNLMGVLILPTILFYLGV